MYPGREKRREWKHVEDTRGKKAGGQERKEGGERGRRGETRKEGKGGRKRNKEG